MILLDIFFCFTISPAHLPSDQQRMLVFDLLCLDSSVAESGASGVFLWPLEGLCYEKIPRILGVCVVCFCEFRCFL